MPKGNFLDDTFEKLAELGVSTVKKSAKAVKQTIDPRKILEGADESAQNSQKSQIEKLSKNKNHTTLDLQKLQNNYKNQDDQKAQVLRHRLFQLVKRGEEEVLERKKQEEQEKKRKLFYEEQEKKRKEEEKRRLEQQIIPQGKIRRSIFSHKKVAKRQQTEVKPASGKQ